MRRETKKFLFDIAEACRRLATFTRNKSFDDYRADDMLKSAVERQFEIIGEALNQLSKSDTATAHKIPDHARIIAFRNILIHGYATIQDRTVWGVLESDLPALTAAVGAMLDEPTEP